MHACMYLRRSMSCFSPCTTFANRHETARIQHVTKNGCKINIEAFGSPGQVEISFQIIKFEYHPVFSTAFPCSHAFDLNSPFLFSLNFYFGDIGIEAIMQLSL